MKSRLKGAVARVSVSQYVFAVTESPNKIVERVKLDLARSLVDLLVANKMVEFTQRDSYDGMEVLFEAKIKVFK